MRMVCYAKKASLSPYVERCTDQQVMFSIGGCHCMLATEVVASHDVFYFHWEEEASEIRDVIVDTYHRVEFALCPERNLLETVTPPPRRPRWLCAPNGGGIWAEPQPDLLAGL